MRKTLILKAWSCKRPKGVEQFQQSDHFRGVKLRTACKHDQTKGHYSKRLALEAKNSPKTVDMPVFEAAFETVFSQRGEGEVILFA